MGQELRGMRARSVGKPVATLCLRRRLAATTILAVAPFLGYGRQAYAACVPSSGTIFICSDTSAGENFTGANAVDNADFRTAAQPPFVVTDDGVFIEGDGHIRFTDNNASSIRNTSGASM
jgi:autotransporter family porin